VDQINELEADLASSRSRLDELSAELDKARSAAEEAKATEQAANELAEGVAALTMERERLLTRIRSLDANVAEAEDRAREAEAQLDEAHQHLAEAERQLAERAGPAVNPSLQLGRQTSLRMRQLALRWRERFVVLSSQIDRLAAFVRSEGADDGMVQLDESTTEEFRSMLEIVTLCQDESEKLVSEVQKLAEAEANE